MDDSGAALGKAMVAMDFRISRHRALSGAEILAARGGNEGKKPCCKFS
jgi:hypothetical protein